MAGPCPGHPRLTLREICEKKDVDARDISAFTRVFDTLCAGMTSGESCALESTFGGSDPQRGFQRPLRLACTLTQLMLQLAQLRPRGRERL